MNSLRLCCLLFATPCDAASRTWKTYAEAGCTGSVSEDTYEVASSQGSATCFNAAGSDYSSIDQWCDESSKQYHQAVFSGTTCDGSSTQQTFPLGQCANVVSGAADEQGTVIVTCDFSPPCFGRDTTAMLASGETVPMISLQSGDLVHDSPDTITRVIVNQHKKAAHLSSPLLEVEHARGTLRISPDHVISVDGVFVAAREATVGSTLTGSSAVTSDLITSEVARVTPTTGGVINPLTASGKIMADGILATTYPEWIAGYMLGRSTVSLSSLLALLFPATAQAFYDHLEPFFQSSSPKLVRLKTRLPALLVAPAFVVADLLVAAAFLAFSLAPKLLAGLVAMGAVQGSLKLRGSNR